MQNKPNFHFAPLKNWMNDPNGTIYSNGEYHMFYQYNPSGSGWGNICWAYAVSRDLINWQRKGVRLAPEEEKGERYCFSGCAVPYEDGYLLSYTSIGFEDWAIQQHAKQRFARTDKEFNNIERLYEKDLTNSDNPFEVREWRDPFIFIHEKNPYMVLSGIRWTAGKSENSILLYRGKNGSLTDWEFVNVLFVDPVNIIECPNMTIKNGRAALIYSTITDRKVKYVAGDFDGQRLWERNRGVVDYSLKSFYATNTSLGKDGENILYGWMGENLLQGDSPDGEYSGCMAIPRIFSLDENYALRFAPVEAISSLEEAELTLKNDEISSDSVRARLSFNFVGEGRFTLTESEREKITVRVRSGEAIISRVSCFPLADVSEERMKLSSGQNHKFDIFIDGSAVEIFADSMYVLSLRMYRADKSEKLFSLKEGKVSSLRAHRMKSAVITGD